MEDQQILSKYNLPGKRNQEHRGDREIFNLIRINQKYCNILKTVKYSTFGARTGSKMT